MNAPWLVLLPLLLLFTWGYVSLRPRAKRRRGLAAFDGIVIVSAILASVGVAWYVEGLYAPADNRVWSTVMSTVAIFHVFPAVLLAGGYVRRFWFEGR